ncbi:MAG: leucine-rich repeat domain-containing protein [Christiangramia sp.]
MIRKFLVLSLGILVLNSCPELINKIYAQEYKAEPNQITLDSLYRTKTYHSLKDIPKNIDSVFRLNLSNQNLKKLPPEIFDLVNLQELNVSQNSLSDLQGLEKLKKIQVLNIGMNDFQSFPNEITKLENLKILKIWWNKIETFPNDFYKNNKLVEELDMTSMFEFDFENNLNKIHLFENLRQLNLGNNQIPDLRIQFSKLKNLEVLGYIRQDSIDLKELCIELKNCSNLRTIHLSVNGIKELPNEILLLENLEELNLYKNQIKTLPTDIVKMEKLKKISLIGNPIDENEIKEVEKQMPNTKIIY